MKIRCLLLLFFLLPGIAFAQIRSSVCVVSPNYDAETKEFLTSVSERLDALGYRDLSKRIAGQTDSIFGSGFVITAPDKKQYVLTNQHVIAMSDSVTLDFYDTQGTSQKFPNCPVIAVDITHDLALVSLPDDAKGIIPLEMYKGEAFDAEDIWSAGYPGLSGEPSWQLAKGNITNSVARVPKLIDPLVSTIIQHSAPVDPGNSGGPLLKPVPGKTGHYTVLGINTWKSFTRQATNFALPIKTANTFVEEVIAGKTNSKTSLHDRIELFNTVLSSGSIEKEEQLESLRLVSQYISLNATRKTGQNEYVYALSRAPTIVRDDIMILSFTSSVFDGIRVAMAWCLVEEVAKTVKGVSIDSSPELESLQAINPATVAYSFATEPLLQTTWIYHQNDWYISEIKTDKGMGTSQAEAFNKRTRIRKRKK